ncbi:MAG TPA: DUF6285 domain-containing protein, partial [Acidimicrobiales bacterium]|nr:DUF6285 domain-containing protein [Acidimicrobiales bacterium]
LDELFAAYEEASGISVDRDRFHWWLVMCTLKWGIGCMGQASVHLTGAVRSVELAAIGRRVCEQEWDLLELLAPDQWRRAGAEAPPDEAPDEPGLHGRPTAPELLQAAREFVSGEAMGSTTGRLQFLLRVTSNVLATVERQWRLGPAQEARFAAGLAGLGASSAAGLAGMIRSGAFDGREDELHPFLAASVRDRLAVANPGRIVPAGGATTG